MKLRFVLAFAAAAVFSTAAAAQDEHRRRLAAELAVMLGDVRRIEANTEPPQHREGLHARLAGALASLPLLLRRAAGDAAAVPLLRAALARRAGIADERILLDPGIGFGKTVSHNLELIRRLDEIRALGFPILLGPSRKSFIGYTLDLPPDQRVEGTAAAVAVGITRGADIVRVHDVREISRVVKMTDAIVRG